MKLILKYIPYFLTVMAFAGVIWRAAAYLENHKPLTKDEVKEIVKTQVDPIFPVLNNLVINQNLMKGEILNQIKKDSASSSKRFDRVTNFLNGFRNDFMEDLKKNELPILLKPKE